MTFPSWGGPSEGGLTRIADSSAGKTDATCALYVWVVVSVAGRKRGGRKYLTILTDGLSGIGRG